MLFHASKQSEIKELVPQISMHGRKYVYAVNHRLTAILFGAPKDDFDLLLDEADGKPIIFECYPNALRKIYFGKTCYLYTLHEEGFLPNQTGWDAEWVCEHTVPVVSEKKLKIFITRSLLLFTQAAASFMRIQPIKNSRIF